MNDNVSTTNVKGLTPPLLNREMDAIVNRATKAERSLTPLEINRIQELQQELVNKEWIAKEAKLAAARKLGAKMKSESDQKRLDAQSPRVKDVISRSNSGDRQDRSAAIKARHARLKGR